ncbi:hypothetical protein QF034_006745 [Streptomyces africanus]|uniref:Uncharacterized protein n=1 Tax=Streptomyces africanus TaxID=231024 RepID=A0ABU0QYN5_9ACTN|nr:hypothetical protein [Streptomyces africanus]
MSRAEIAQDAMPGRPALRTDRHIASCTAGMSRALLPSTSGASSAVRKSPTAAGPYVQPVPVASPADTSQITTVVESQASVPSASGASVGTVYTDTAGRWSSIGSPRRPQTACWSCGSTFVR